MDSLRRSFFSNKKILKFKKRLGEDRIMDSLNRFFLPKNFLEFIKNWEKIGLWIPLFVFYQIKNVFDF